MLSGRVRFGQLRSSGTRRNRRHLLDSGAGVDTTEIPEFGTILAALLERRELAEDEMRTMMGALMTGRCGDTEAAAFLVALRMKGETAAEIAAAARVLHEHMLRWDPGCDNALDTCGTGGDGTGTFNISTAAAFVVAGPAV